MAIEDQNIKIKFDSNAQQVTGETNKLAASLDITEVAATNVKKTFRELDKTFEEVYGDLQPLTTRMGEAEDRLYELALAGQTASQEYKDLLASVANYRKVQIQTDQVVDAAATTLGQKLGGAAQIAATGVQGVTAGMALFGNQSEDTEKALLKVQAAMAFADAISSVSSLGGQFKVFKTVVTDTFAKIIAVKAADKAATEAGTVSQLRQNLAVLANPYVIAGVALAALAIATYAWVKSSDEAAKQEERTATSVKNNTEQTEKLKQSIEEAKNSTQSSNEIEVLRAKAYGATDKEIQKLIVSQKDLAIATTGTQSKSAYDNLLKSNSSYWAAVKTGNQDLIDSAKDGQDQAKELYKQSNDSYNEAIIDGVKFTLQSQIDTNAKSESEAEKASTKAADRKKKAVEKGEKDEKDAIAKREAARAAREKKAIEDFQEEQNIVGQLTGIKDEKQKESEDKTLQQGTDNLVQIKFFADEEMKIEQAKADQKKILEDSRENLLNAGLSFLSKIAGKNKLLQKAAIIAENAVAIGRSLIANSAGNAQAAAVAAPLIANPFTAPAATASLAAAVLNNNISTGLGIAGIVSATSKALQAVGGGGGASGGAVSASGGGGAAAGGGAPPAVAFNNTSENQIGQSVARTQADQPPLQVFVSEKDISDAQRDVKVLVAKNTF